MTFYVVEEVRAIDHQLLGHTANIDACATQRSVLNHGDFARRSEMRGSNSR
jgi:hypothetical protein